MNKPNVKVIVFDIDGTLTDEVSWLKMTNALGADVNVHQHIFEDFKKGILTYPEAKSKLIKLWQSTRKANQTELIKIFSSWDLKSDAQTVVNYLKSKYTVILISGSVDLYVKTVADTLNIKKWYANTTLVWDKNNEICDFHYEANQAQKKLEQLHEYLTESGFKNEDCLVVGDGDSDLVLFQELPLGIAVNKKSYPDLEKLAWKQISTLSEIKEIL